jgi:hypothetical protein
MRRILTLLAVVALMLVMLVMTATSAMAVRVPEEPGEPLLSGGPRNLVLHCGPFFEPILGVEVHGALPAGNQGQGGNCIFAPPPQ